MAKAFEFYGNSDTTDTQRFVETFDKFFDCFNVRNLSEHRQKRKPNLRPYTSTDDERLTVSTTFLIQNSLLKHNHTSHCIPQWLEDDFLGYLKEWKDSVDSRQGFKKGEKSLMCLSQETVEGLHMSGM